MFASTSGGRLFFFRKLIDLPFVGLIGISISYTYFVSLYIEIDVPGRVLLRCTIYTVGHIYQYVHTDAHPIQNGVIIFCFKWDKKDKEQLVKIVLNFSV